MKRKIAVLITVFLLVAVLSVPVVYAAKEDNSSKSDFFKSMFDSMRSRVDQAKGKGDITEKDANEWNEHFRYMEEYHERNGFSGPCGGFGGRRSGMGMMGRYNNRGL